MVLHEAPTRGRHSSSVASGCLRINSRSRSRPSGPSVGGWPSPWGLGSSDRVLRYCSNSRVTKETLTRKQRAIWRKKASPRWAVSRTRGRRS